MLNWIWLGMIIIATIVGGFSGRLQPMTEGAFAQAKSAIMDLALPYIGVWAVWLGMMRLAERAGLVQALARALRPIMRWLFPDVPADHPAMGAMVLTMSANMLGLGNAATPLGLRALAHLNKLNARPGVASNAMITFLTICTASIQLLPATAITVLALAPSQALRKSDPTVIVAPAFIATVCAMTVGIFLARFLAKLPVFAPVDDPDAPKVTQEVKDDPTAVEVANPTPLTGRGQFLLVVYYAMFALLFYILVCPEVSNILVQTIRAQVPWLIPGNWTFGNAWPDTENQFVRIIRALSMLAIPFMLSFFPLYAALRGVKVYEQFCDGAKESFATAQRVIPYLVAMLVAMRLLRDSGALDALLNVLRTPLQWVGFPPEILPLALMRPLSGSASFGLMADLVAKHGADSLIGRTAATLYGSTETTFYVIAVYFGSVGIRKTRHAVIAGLSADIVATIVTVYICNRMFG